MLLLLVAGLLLRLPLCRLQEMASPAQSLALRMKLQLVIQTRLVLLALARALLQTAQLDHSARRLQPTRPLLFHVRQDRNTQELLPVVKMIVPPAQPASSALQAQLAKQLARMVSTVQRALYLSTSTRVPQVLLLPALTRPRTLPPAKVAPLVLTVLRAQLLEVRRLAREALTVLLTLSSDLHALQESIPRVVTSKLVETV